jgi:hypothetical protein
VTDTTSRQGPLIADLESFFSRNYALWVKFYKLMLTMQP